MDTLNHETIAQGRLISIDDDQTSTEIRQRTRARPWITSRANWRDAGRLLSKECPSTDKMCDVTHRLECWNVPTCQVAMSQLLIVWFPMRLEAVSTIDRSILHRFERDFTFLATFNTSRGIHFTISVPSKLPALITMRRWIRKAFFGEELFFAFAMKEGSATCFADKHGRFGVFNFRHDFCLLL